MHYFNSAKNVDKNLMGQCSLHCILTSINKTNAGILKADVNLLVAACAGVIVGCLLVLIIITQLSTYFEAQLLLLKHLGEGY